MLHKKISLQLTSDALLFFNYFVNDLYALRILTISSINYPCHTPGTTVSVSPRYIKVIHAVKVLKLLASTDLFVSKLDLRKLIVRLSFKLTDSKYTPIAQLVVVF